MVELIAAFSALNAAFNGVKAVVKTGREVEDVFKQLTKWAEAVDDLNHWLGKDTKPSIWKPIKFDTSETKEAFDKMAAKQKLADMEKEIYHMFTWGELGHLGMSGYQEFQQLRRDIKSGREKMVRDQLKRRQDLVDTLVEWTLAIIIGVSASMALYYFIAFMLTQKGSW